ncbi:hypothetical protein BFG60_5085 [Microcystis aeruginosa NIES-98]|nr:hypothetical protein BFG60_5085 [Microcystis aeruginosa NIES-98]
MICGIGELGKLSHHPITPKPYHPKTLLPEQCLRIDQKRDTMIGCSV